MQIRNRRAWKKAPTLFFQSKHTEADPDQKYGAVVYPLNQKQVQLIGFKVITTVDPGGDEQKIRKVETFNEKAEHKRIELIENSKSMQSESQDIVTESLINVISRSERDFPPDCNGYNRESAPSDYMFTHLIQ